MLLELDTHSLPRHQLAEPLPRCVAEGLLLLGSVDPRDADPVLHLVGVEDGDRVAVSNLDYGAFEDAGCGAAEWEEGTERRRSTKRMEKLEPGLSIGNAPWCGRTLWGKRDEDNDWLSMLLPLEESRRSFSEDLSVNITYRTNLIKRNYIKY